MTATNLRHELSDRLGLADASQDWGIINADARRIDEFIDFFESNELVSTQKFQMAELIIASANEAMIEHGEVVEPSRRFRDFIRRHSNEFRDQIDYWATLGSSDEFPIAMVLVKLAAGDGVERD